MVATHWAFCGLVATKWRELGIEEQSMRYMKDFLHFWRTIGYVLGVDDRYNVCNPSADPLTHIISVKHRLMKTTLCDQRILKDSQHLTVPLFKGLVKINPLIDERVFRNLTYRLLGIEGMSTPPETTFQKFLTFLLETVVG